MYDVCTKEGPFLSHCNSTVKRTLDVLVILEQPHRTPLVLVFHTTPSKTVYYALVISLAAGRIDGQDHTGPGPVQLEGQGPYAVCLLFLRVVRVRLYTVQVQLQLQWETTARHLSTASVASSSRGPSSLCSSTKFSYDYFISSSRPRTFQ